MKSIYYRQPYQETLVRKVKATINEASEVLFSPKAGRVEKVRAVYRLVKLVPVILNELPEPAVENTSRPLAHIIIGIRDRFFRRLMLPTRHDFLQGFVNLVIMVIDTDFYHSFVLWWLWEIKTSDLPPLGPLQPDPHFFKSEQEVN